jgi:predicted metalloprotease with PDZ domain
VALCLDLTLRAEGKTNLDQVMRTLWLRSKAGAPSGPEKAAGRVTGKATGKATRPSQLQAGSITEADIAAVLQQLGGRSFAPELAQWVHGTADLPLDKLLTQQGVQVVEDKPQLAQRLGLRVAEANGAVQVKVVLRGGAAEQAGFCAGDEWLAVGSARGGQWRLNKLDDLLLYTGEVAGSAPGKAAKSKAVQALVSRDKRLHALTLQLPSAERADLATWVLRTSDAVRVDTWLAG